MRQASPLLALLAVFAAASALPAPTADAAGDPRRNVKGSHCRPGERVAYSCNLGRKTVSVCLGANQATYRYGPPGKPEMTLASSGQDGALHRELVTGGGGGTQVHLRFSNAGHEYIIYSGVQGALHDHPGDRWSGLVVMRGEAQVSSQDCKRNGALQRWTHNETDFIAESDDPTYEMWF